MDERGSYQYFEDINLGLLRLWNGRRGLRVLDVGCGFATTSRKIQQLGNEVTGIDESEVACDVASKRIGRIIHGRVEEASLGDERFDVIIFADVLEHLAWPGATLRRYLAWLKVDGTVLVSLPNVGLWSVRVAHLLGRWDYQETGVLDATHLRFFTRKSARQLLTRAGLEPTGVTYTPGLARPLVPTVKRLLARGDSAPHDPEALLKSNAYRAYTRTVYPLERLVASAWPGMLAFQMIYEARRSA